MGGAFATIVAKKGVSTIPPRVLMLWRNGVALIVVGTYTLILYPVPEITSGLLAVALGIGILGPYLHGLFFLQSLERIDAAKASLMNRVQPALVFGLSWLVLRKVPERARHGLPVSS